MEKTSPKDPDKQSNALLFFLIGTIVLTAVFLLWNYYRPRFIVAKCDNIARESEKAILRRSLKGDQNIKSYNEIFNSCLKDFGYKL